MTDDSVSTLNESEDGNVTAEQSEGGYVKTATYNYSKSTAATILVESPFLLIPRSKLADFFAFQQ